MCIYEIVLQDEKFQLHKLVKVKDTIYDSIQKKELVMWFWIYSETSEFFYFDLWDQLDHAKIGQYVSYKNFIFKVVSVNNNKKINYS
ncbi:hypothetical protein OSH00_09930 [Acinetobacter sp. A-IN1]|uniref:Uncharacterized protein n=1 Tax=Acinetobacter nematophilus TaxID=2994642 RepID=A0A9X3DU55_9GAMM|nr:hypothetical protein [Acinetobacter nematophilus]MCX5468065.1 hypothetical protein [Acinetobacter nematophilus]